MSDLKVVSLEREDKPKLVLRQLNGRYRCIVRYRGYVITAVLCAEKLSPSRDWIFLGDYYSDQVSRHWTNVDDIEILEVLAKIEHDGPELPLPWWKRLFSRRPHG